MRREKRRERGGQGKREKREGDRVRGERKGTERWTG